MNAMMIQMNENTGYQDFIFFVLIFYAIFLYLLYSGKKHLSEFSPNTKGYLKFVGRISLYANMSVLTALFTIFGWMMMAIVSALKDGHWKGDWGKFVEDDPFVPFVYTGAIGFQLLLVSGQIWMFCGYSEAVKRVTADDVRSMSSVIGLDRETAEFGN
jgi:hypothetical protein